MATEITMPTLAAAMTEGGVARWYKQEGDAVAAGDVLLEIETDKALVEFESPAGGILADILVPAGSQNVQVGTRLAWLLQPGETIPEVASVAVEQVASVVAEKAAEAYVVGLDASVRASDRVASSPLARRLAQRHGLSLASIKGSGPGGRIVRVDVEAAARAVAGQAPVPTGTPSPVVTWAAPASDHEDIPHTNMRRAIARRLSESKRQAPHFYLSVDCEIDALLALRAQINAAWDATKVSVNDLVVRAVALTLRRVPAANASWTDEAIRRWKDVDLSVAVATPAGLITPVLRRADTKGLGALSAELRELSSRAREGRLQPAEYEGGGFSISNLGMFGVREFAAILNPPQACILAVGAGEQRPVVRDGALAVATLMTCTLSVDHRVIDGVVGAEFLSVFKGLIEHPLGILL